MKTLVTALALSLTPALAMAGGCFWDRGSEEASQCGDGQIYDAATQSCVSTATS